MQQPQLTESIKQATATTVDVTADGFYSEILAHTEYSRLSTLAARLFMGKDQERENDRTSCSKPT